MIERFKQFPRALKSQCRSVRVGEIPLLIAHPDWDKSAPVVIWLHGRTANKELDPGRYLRWIRAGFAACSVDLPGHGERLTREAQTPEHTLDTIQQAVDEIDQIVAFLQDPANFAREHGDCVFDSSRMGIGGMSMGGMVALSRLCKPHGFSCCALEATTGNLRGLYFSEDGSSRWSVEHDPSRVAEIDPMEHLEGFNPLPLLAVHSLADELVPIASQRVFLDRLRAHYAQTGASTDLIQTLYFEQTGAPMEHLGFGSCSNDAKNAQTAFFAKHFS